ncbi:hypothetical protein [Desertivirga arenae]|uniref:hypothetical protein n=1 Tax=Desertivirga arenae TaxID=2810309 RepID=UPI001A96B568|nr:hypothetical protein [Pedobacter sp. SYSU D00823]
MVLNEKKYFRLTDEEEIIHENEVIDNHNEDLESEEPDYYSYWDDTNENDD